MALTPVRLTEVADSGTLAKFFDNQMCVMPVKILSVREDHGDTWLTDGDALAYYSPVFEEFYIVSALDARQAALDIAEWEHARIVAEEADKAHAKQKMESDRVTLRLLRAIYGDNFEKLEG